MFNFRYLPSCYSLNSNLARFLSGISHRLRHACVHQRPFVLYFGKYVNKIVCQMLDQESIPKYRQNLSIFTFTADAFTAIIQTINFCVCFFQYCSKFFASIVVSLVMRILKPNFVTNDDDKYFQPLVCHYKAIGVDLVLISGLVDYTYLKMKIKPN